MINHLGTILLLLLLSLPRLLLGQQSGQESSKPLIRAAGEAVVTAKPDRAQLDIGVVTQAATAEAAARQNAVVQEELSKQLQDTLSTAAEVKSTRYSVTPVYRYPKEGSPTISGYSAQTTLQVQIDDLSRVGRIIDIASQSGANQIQRLRFSIRDELSLQLEALRQATAAAKAKAEAMAAALGLRIIGILEVAEESSLIQPLEDRAFAVAEASPRASQTAIEPGVVEIRARVTLAVEVAAR